MRKILLIAPFMLACLAHAEGLPDLGDI